MDWLLIALLALTLIPLLFASWIAVAGDRVGDFTEPPTLNTRGPDEETWTSP